jgi:hypothetical protein
LGPRKTIFFLPQLSYIKNDKAGGNQKCLNHKMFPF